LTPWLYRDKPARMFIRRTKTRPTDGGEAYFTYRLVETRRVGRAVKQITLMNLGAHFTVPEAKWPAFVGRVQDTLHGQLTAVGDSLSESERVLADRCAAGIIARRGHDVASAPQPDDAGADVIGGVANEPAAFAPADAPDTGCAAGGTGVSGGRFQEVDLGTLELVRPRSVGVEHAAVTMVRALGFDHHLAKLGFNKNQIAAALGNIIGRMAVPGSELSTYEWLRTATALGELLEYDYEGMSLAQLYRSADQLLKHREALESYLFGAAQKLFGFQETITLYDLTNTYFEGQATGILKAKHGRSKEKRNDCPLVTMGLVLDTNGFPKRSRIFAGNASEPQTMKAMLTDLGAAAGTTVVMDAGIATTANLTWLKENRYHYIVVSRKLTRQFDATLATEVKTAGDDPILVQKILDPAAGEALMYCYSAARAEKEKAMDATYAERFEAALTKIKESLTRPRRSTTKPSVIHQRIGRAKQRYARAARHYTIDVTVDPTGKTVTAIGWTKSPVKGSALDHPGVYCLRTTLTAPSEAEIWHIYVMLTNLEAVFRSLKTDLGLRPIYHKIDRRVEAHLFISLLAYYFVHTLRLKLKACGIHDSWDTLRKVLATQQRITATLQRRDRRIVHVRKATRLEPRQQKIAKALGLTTNPGGTRQAIL
jgi:transposase